MAKAPAGDVRAAWYARPTDRYGHGVLGDAIEGGSLVATTAAGSRVELVLPESHVFEDITPRIVDLDGDGRNEIVTVRSSLARGAAVAVFGLEGGHLVERASTPEIGRANRWLSIAGIGSYLRRGETVVAWVETPHIGGTLKFGRFSGGRLTVSTVVRGNASNHRIGSTLVSMSASADIDGDGVAELALPAADRRSLLVVKGGVARAYPIGGRIDGPIRYGGGSFHLVDDRGRSVRIDP